MVSNKLLAKTLVQKKKPEKIQEKIGGKNAGKNSVPNEIEFRAITMGKIHDKIKFTPKMKFTTKSNLYAN